MQLLVTGSAGCTGRHVVERLLARRDRVIVVASLGNILIGGRADWHRTEDAAGA